MMLFGLDFVRKNSPSAAKDGEGVQANLEPGCSAFGEDAEDVVKDLLRYRRSSVILSLGMPAISYTSRERQDLDPHASEPDIH